MSTILSSFQNQDERFSAARQADGLPLPLGLRLLSLRAGVLQVRLSRRRRQQQLFRQWRGYGNQRLLPILKYSINRILRSHLSKSKSTLHADDLLNELPKVTQEEHIGTLKYSARI